VAGAFFFARPPAASRPSARGGRRRRRPALPELGVASPSLCQPGRPSRLPAPCPDRPADRRLGAWLPADTKKASVRRPTPQVFRTRWVGGSGD